MKLREKFRKKKITRQEPFNKKVKKLRRKKVYVKEKCKFVDENGKKCTRNAIGSGQLCFKHGGTKDLTNVLSVEALQLYTAEVGKIKKFDPFMHPLQMIDLSRQGLSEVEIAAEIGIGISTLRKWSEDYEPFTIAYEIGQALHESWWLKQGKAGLNDRFFNTSLFKFLTSNKLGYAEKTESKNLNMTAHGVLVVPAKQTELEWEQAGPAGEVIDVKSD